MQEDHVSMGWAGARKLRRAVDALTRVLAIELLTAARGIELRAPIEPAAATGAVITALRAAVPGAAPTATSHPRSRRPWSSSARAPSGPPAEAITGPLA
jgi:histidine ammonia-lyase